MNRLIRFAISLSLAALVCRPHNDRCVAQEPGPQIIALTLRPAPLPSPALKYRLVPGAWERKPGNAAQFYYRALLMNRSFDRRGRDELELKGYQHWYAGPLTAETRASLKNWVSTFSGGAYNELRTACYRDHCDFEYNIRSLNGTEAISFLLPEVQDMREFAKHLQGKSHLEIDEGKFDEALETLRLGYQLAHDAGSEPLIINGLVGIACASVMNAETEQWIGAKDSPNLYWAITALHRPFVDLRPSMQYETRLPLQMFPVIADAENAEHSPDEWMRLLRKLVQDVNEMGGSGVTTPPTSLAEQLAASLMVMKAFPIAKKDLKKQGYTDEQLAAMPVGKIVAIHMKQVCEYLCQEYAKGLYLDDLQRDEYYEQLDKRLLDEGFFRNGDREPIPLASTLLPAVSSAIRAQVRLERDFAALRTLEAIRAHLAITGSLPDQLADITVVPVPRNPATGEAFPYHRDGNGATLESPVVHKSQGPTQGKRYVLTSIPR